eukprot:TRINITY_DN329_c1_g2_i2.p1 TRINITY_DN329_c1_g2~~TRINITY_DN329_c1_g2_i2.p1  ORF type:complete len:532 (-),score=84.75 TRINITY_DN329_c1_g2_i2:2787-4382(-)
MSTQQENKSSRGFGWGLGRNKRAEVMAAIASDEKLKSLVENSKPAPAPFNGVVYQEVGGADAPTENLSPTSSMTASAKGVDSSSLPPERTTSDQSIIMDTGFQAVARTGSLALHELDEIPQDETQELPDTQQNIPASDVTPISEATKTLGAINEESDNNGNARPQSAREENPGTKKNWLKGFFGSFRKRQGQTDSQKNFVEGRDKSCKQIQEDGEDPMDTSRSPPEISPNNVESAEIQDNDESPITETDNTEATVMENQHEIEEIPSREPLLVQSIPAQQEDEEEEEKEEEKQVKPKSNIPPPPPLPPKRIDRSHPGDVSSIASRFNIPEKPLIPKVAKAKSYLKDDEVGVNLGMRRAVSHSKKKLADELPATSSNTKQSSMGSNTNSQEKQEDENEAVSQLDEENRVQKLMKGWHKGAPIKAQALGEEGQEPEEVIILTQEDQDKQPKAAPPKNENISSIRDKFKAQEQRFLEKRASKLGEAAVAASGVKGAVMKFDVPPPKPPKKQPSKDTSFGQNLLKFQEESKQDSK